MNITFKAADHLQERTVYSLERAPVAGERVEVIWTEFCDDKKRDVSKGFSGVVDKVWFTYKDKTADHLCVVFLK